MVPTLYKTDALVLDIAGPLGRSILINYHSICLEQCFPTRVPHSFRGSEINRRINLKKTHTPRKIPSASFSLAIGNIGINPVRFYPLFFVFAVRGSVGYEKLL